MKLDILVLAAHPDDAELCCGGTLARVIQQGKKAGIVDMTRGEMGTRGTPELRLKEADKAASILGLEARENLGLPDAHLENTPEYRKKIIRMIRKYRPHVCLVGAPSDRHPDHGNSTRLALDAIFYSGLAKIKTTDDEGNSQERWRPPHVLHYMQDRPFEPDLIFDITETFDVKKEAILAFGSQFNVADPGDEPKSYISSERFFKGIEARARHYGHMIGVTYGEPFKYYNGPLPLNSFDPLFQTSPFR